MYFELNKNFQFHCSAQYKMYLKVLFGLHFLVLLTMWVKVGGEVLVEDIGIRWPFYQTLQLPSAYPWEYVWCFSFIPLIFAVLSFKRNKVSVVRLENTDSQVPAHTIMKRKKNVKTLNYFMLF